MYNLLTQLSLLVTASKKYLLLVVPVGGTWWFTKRLEMKKIDSGVFRVGLYNVRRQCFNFVIVLLLGRGGGGGGVK